jgi:threonine dehydrogenase-like Zn-dependent dehydrogenase
MANMRRILGKSASGFFKILEEPIPPLKKGEVLVEVHASAISPGTELGKIKISGEKPPENEKYRGFGYQNAGIVLETSEDYPHIKPGQRVACMGAGYAVHGTHACVPVNLLSPLPDNVSFEEGAFIALAATSLNAVRRAELQLGEFVLVMGLGIVGQFVAQQARLAGTHVLAADRFALRGEAAKKSGIENICLDTDALQETAAKFTRGYGMDCAFICFGGDATAGFNAAVKTMKVTPDTHVCGRVVIPGGATITQRFGSGLGNLDIRSAARTGPGYHDEAYEYGADYPKVFVQWTTKRNMEELLGWISAGRLMVKPMITHQVPLDEAPDVCRLIIEHPEQTLGVVLKMK